MEDKAANQILANLENGAAAPAGRALEQLDAWIIAKVLDRTARFNAPPFSQPTGRWTPAGALAQFLERRAQTVAQLESNPDLRRRLIDHPAFGPIDGYQWVLAVAAHSARHTAQILEVKAAPDFPAR